MANRWVGVTIDCVDVERVAGFWSALLDRPQGPSEPGWVDMALAVPLMDSDRARRELGWTPARRGTDALAELIDAMRRGADYATPPLARATSGPARIRELFTGLGARP